jgi:putative transposase
VFNLAAPPGFSGFDLNRPLRVYYRHLPHWRQDNATYFVTFRLADSLPQDQLQYLKRLRAEWERKHPAPRSENDWEEHCRDVIRRTEAWLDEGHGACYFREERWANDLRDRLQHFDGERYHLGSWVIMPNHCHVVIRPFLGHELEDLIGAMKSIVAKHINRELSHNGELWQAESHDRIIRDEEHLYRAIQYIGRNPGKAGIPSNQWRRWIHPNWQAVGWGFES